MPASSRVGLLPGFLEPRLFFAMLVQSIAAALAAPAYVSSSTGNSDNAIADARLRLVFQLAFS